MKRKEVQRYAVLLVMAGMLSACNSVSSDKAGPAASGKKVTVVSVEKVSRGPISNRLYLTGEAVPVRSAGLGSPAEGPVKGLRVREGEQVRAGERILSIGRKKGAEALVSMQREKLRKEEENLKRIRNLVKQEAVPGELLDEAMVAFEQASSEYAKAQEALNDYFIRAPWAGVISSVKVRDGNFVPARMILVEMYDPDSMVIRTSLPEKDAVHVRMGMAASVRLDAYPDHLFPGSVVRVYPYLQPETRTRVFEVKLNRPVKLLPGMFARIILDLEKVENALTVPLHALTATAAGSAAVFVVTEGKAVLREITTGIETERSIQVLSGVEAGDPVIVAGRMSKSFPSARWLSGRIASR